MSTFYCGQRLSTKGCRCTVRYVGEVQGKNGQWLGVEWDDPSRGKHSGTHENVEYFKCRSNHPAPASFIRPSAVWDKPVTFIDALRSKYAAATTSADGDVPYDPDIQIVRISGKAAEEVGFDKIARQQAQLENLRIVVLDDMRIGHEDHPKDLVPQTCPSITNLDLGRNLFETLGEIASICAGLDKLKSLKLDGNRFRDYDLLESTSCPDLKALSRLDTLELDNVLLNTTELNFLLVHFPSLKHISASSNQLGSLADCRLPPDLILANLEDNDFTSFSDIESLALSCAQLQTLNLKNNRITSASNSPIKNTPQLSHSITTLDLSYNNITSWSLINLLPSIFPGLLHLRISHNPLFTSLKTPDCKPLTSADGYMLTIARLPRLETLNYSKITEKERLNAETYYLSQIAAEIAKVPVEQEEVVLAQHPRWRGLCEEYGEPKIERGVGGGMDPNSLAARLITCTFQYRPSYSSSFPSSTVTPPNSAQSFTIELPNTFNIYTVLGMVGRRLNIPPLHTRLIWETGEREHVKPPPNTWIGVQEWDSSDEDEMGEGKGEEWREREVELVAGTRPLGTVVEGVEARIRVEMK